MNGPMALNSIFAADEFHPYPNAAKAGKTEQVLQLDPVLQSQARTNMNKSRLFLLLNG